MNHTLLGNINTSKIQSCSHTQTHTKDLKIQWRSFEFQTRIAHTLWKPTKVCPTALKFYIFSKDPRCVLLLFFTKLNVRQILANVTCQLIDDCEVSQSCPTLCDPMDYSLPGSSVHGIFQARVLEQLIDDNCPLKSSRNTQPKKKKKLGGKNSFGVGSHYNFFKLKRKIL